MPLDLLVVGVSRLAEGISLIGAGADIADRFRFIRLVAPTPSGVLQPQHHRLKDQTEPRPFDLIRVEAPWADNRLTQPENRVLNDDPWELLERPASRPHLQRLERMPLQAGALFDTPGPSLRPGAAEPASIAYVEPVDPIAVCDWSAARERYRTRFHFTSGGIRYDLPFTDLHYSQVLRARGEGSYSLATLGCRAPHGLRILVTLGEPFRGFCYKMVSALVPRRTVTLWPDATTPSFPSAIGNAADHAVHVPRSIVAGA